MFEIQKQLFWSKLKVGLVVTLAFSILFITIFFAGSIEKIFSPKAELKAQIQNVKGLRRGAPVWVSGIEVGSVKSIDLHPEYGTVVTLSVDKNALRFLKKDSEASVLTMGLLGDKYIELSGGSLYADSIKHGDMIKGTAQIEMKDIMERSAVSIQKMNEFMTKLENIIVKLERGEGSVSKFLTDPALYNNLKETTETLAAILKDIENGQGTIAMLLEDPTLYNRILASTASIEEFGKKLNEEQGTLRRLIEEPDLYENLNALSIQLSSLLEKINAGEGVAGDLISNKELSKDLKDSIGAIKELTEDMKENPKRYFKFSLF